MAEQESIKPTSAADFRRRSTFVVKIDETLTVEMRRSDMMTMLMNNALPLPMLEAAMNFETAINENREKRKAAGLGSETMMEQYAGMDKKMMADMVDAMRHYAIIHVIKPRIVPEDDGNPEHIPVGMLTASQLMSIFYSSPEDQEKEGPVIEKDEAKDFRGEPTPVVGNDRQDSQAVRTTAKLLDLPKREAVSA